MITKINVKLQTEVWAGFGGMYCESVHKRKATVFARHTVLMHLHLKCCVYLRPHVYWNANEDKKKDI